MPERFDSLVYLSFRDFFRTAALLSRPEESLEHTSQERVLLLKIGDE